jgi:octanoyl-[GcvH]:protein N-octanoyltransferase
LNWTLRRESPGKDAENDIAGEMALLDDALADPARAILRLWRTHPCLVVTPLLAHRAGFAAAAEASARRGWPVIVRRTGGGPVPQTRGTLNVSLAFATAREAAPGIDLVFRNFADRLRTALTACGQASEIGEIAGSCCPGRYDIALGGRKIIGIAQRRRQGSKDGTSLAAMLVHAMVWLEGTLDDGIDALELFLGEAEAPERFRRERMGTMEEIAGVPSSAFEAALQGITKAASAP